MISPCRGRHPSMKRPMMAYAMSGRTGPKWPFSERRPDGTRNLPPRPLAAGLRRCNPSLYLRRNSTLIGQPTGGATEGPAFAISDKS